MKNRYWDYMQRIHPSQEYTNALESMMQATLIKKKHRKQSFTVCVAACVLLAIILSGTALFQHNPKDIIVSPNHDASATSQTVRPIDGSNTSNSVKTVPSLKADYTICHLDGFTMDEKGISKYDEESLLLAGYFGKPMENIPGLIICNIQGDIEWSYSDEEAKDQSYVKAVPYGEESIVALKRLGGDANCDVFELFENGVLVKRIAEFPSVQQFSLVSEGILYATSSSTGTTIGKMDFNGTIVWQLELERNITLNGLTSFNDKHISWGSRTDSTSKYGVVICFDDIGNILWRYDSQTPEVINGAIWRDDENTVIYGNMRTYGYSSFVANLFNGTITFKTVTEATSLTDSGQELTSREVTSMLPYGDGYIFTLNMSLSQDTVLRITDNTGTVLSESCIPNDAVGLTYTERLFTIEEDIYLICYGKASGYDITNWGWDMDDETSTLADIPNVLLIQKISSLVE